MTRSFQSTPFQNPVGVAQALGWRTEERKEILASNIGYNAVLTNRWHVTGDRGHMTHEISIKVRYFSSYCFMLDFLGIGATIHTRRENQCLPYERFLSCWFSKCPCCRPEKVANTANAIFIIFLICRNWATKNATEQSGYFLFSQNFGHFAIFVYFVEIL